ncbi:MAG: YggS family pyridoxal phosphate-dependent enzyme, partial [Alphaproteobacteria bacterium]|nr:YggS family pyridoxal phosphate-dependent enzyme [Alphaproteobacteria bacterium]
MDDAIQAAIGAVRARIADAARAAGRHPAAVTLVAVSKTFGADAVQAALDAGQRVFGENRVQEAAAKFPRLKARYPDLELHLIGPLQTNKAREAVALFDVIESVDREKLARELAKEMARAGRRPRLYVQVNIGEEPQKAGVAPGELDALLAACRGLGLAIEGLMCIPPADQPPAPFFARLRELAARHALPVASMGMSGDYAEAIAEGATHVRVGSAIFGVRPRPPAEPG